MDIFTLAAKLKLDSGDFEKNLRKMDREGKTFADSLKNTFEKVKNLAVAVGSAFAVKKIANGLWNVANAAAQAGDKIDKQSQALGMSRKAYQEWDYILGQSGASIDSMGVSMKTLNSALLESSDDTKKALSKLHLSTTELKHMNQEDAFKKVVEAFQKIPAGAQKSALAVQLFGRNGQELLPLLNSSAESIDELRRQANELGLVMSDDDVNAAVAFGDALDTLKRTFTSFKYRFGAQILPALTNGMGKITDYAGKLRKAYDERGFAGVFDTIVNDVKNIKWPTWADVRAAVETGWETIKKGVAGLGKLVFGENEKGEVNYPTWGEIGEAIKTEWEKIVEEAGKLTGFVFGNIGDASTIIASIEEKWKNLKETVTTNAIDFISGLTGTDSETAERILNTLVTSLEAIGAAITTYSLVTALPTVINTIVGLFTSGITAVNPVALAIGVIAAAGVLIYKNWDGIQQFFEDLWGAVSTAVSTAWGKVEDWWTKDILGPVKEKWEGISSFITGIWEGITGTIQTAIDKINEFFGLRDDGFTTESGQHFTGSSYDMQSQGQSGPQRNRTVTGTASEDQMRGLATGAWNIPFDNYPALLHRDEMVLNATQARQYREGKGNGAGIDFDAMVSRIVAAVTEGIENANIDLDGEKITRNVNRRLAANVRAKRFA